MKILIVCSYKDYRSDGIAPFILEQVGAIEKEGVAVSYFLLKGNGILGYLSEISRFKRAVKDFTPDIIHAHYGLCGLFANLQRKIPVVTTYHGSDINNKSNLKYSKLSIWLSAWNIFVSKRQVVKAGVKTRYSVIPCGVDTNIFYPLDKEYCRKILGWNMEQTYILFSKAFFVEVKNYPLAKTAVDLLGNDAHLIELDGYTREEVNLLMNASDVALMTSFSEGSPQFIKEAMATNCPIVSTDVGDVSELLYGVSNSYLCTYSKDDVADKIKMILFSKNIKTNGKKRIDNYYGLSTVTKQIVDIYNKL